MQSTTYEYKVMFAIVKQPMTGFKPYSKDLEIEIKLRWFFRWYKKIVWLKMSLIQSLTIDLIAFLKQFPKSLKRDSSVNKFKNESVGLFHNTLDDSLWT